MSWLDRPLRRPDLWLTHLECAACGWRTAPDAGTLRDLLWPRSACPDCGALVAMALPDCPHCQAGLIHANASPARVTRSLFRLPKTLEQGLWGHFTCRTCDKVFDKWGRKV